MTKGILCSRFLQAAALGCVATLSIIGCFDLEDPHYERECYPHRKRYCDEGLECAKDEWKCYPVCNATADCSSPHDSCIRGYCRPVFFSCATPADCPPEWTCENTMCVKRRALGAACDEAGQCLSGYCVDKICCDAACDSLCQSCLATFTGQPDMDGTCSYVQRGLDPDSECDRGLGCDGAGACFAPKGNGEPCENGFECTSGLCADGLCCNAPCDGTCERCDDPLMPGFCLLIPEATDPSEECPGYDTCNGKGSCYSGSLGAPCRAALAATDCSSGFCVDARCCDNSCDGVCARCDLPESRGTCAPITWIEDPGLCDYQSPSGDCAVAPCTCSATGACAFPWKGTKQMGSTALDESWGVAVDSAGNVYLGGTTAGSLDGSLHTDSDLFAIKLDFSGTTQWVRQLGPGSGDSGYGIATDAAGNAYVAGTTGGSFDGNSGAGMSDLCIVKYDAAGSKRWTRQLGTAVDDWTRAVTTDTNGNVYVAGETGGDLDGNKSAGGSDIFVVKYDANGTKQWTRLIGTAAWDYAYAVCTDTTGNIFVAGHTFVTQTDLLLAKLDSLGTTQWVRQLESPGTIAYGVAADPSGNAYAVGNTLIVKYDADGTKQWTRSIGATANGVGTDRAGHVYVVGMTSGSLDGNPSFGSYDGFLVKYDPSGAKWWTRQFGTADRDEARGVAADAVGNIYVTGWTTGSMDGNPNAGAEDLFVVKFDSAGAKQ